MNLLQRSGQWLNSRWLRTRLGQWLCGHWLRRFGPRQTAPVHRIGTVTIPVPTSFPSAVTQADALSSAPDLAQRTWYSTPTNRPTSPGRYSGSSQSARNPLADLQHQKELKLGLALGRPGGQGEVFPLVEFPEFVYKRYHHPIRGAAESFNELILAGEALAPGLERTGVAAVWPILTCGTEDEVDGYVMRRIPDRFSIDMKTPYGAHIEAATLDHALPIDPRATFYPIREVSTTERLHIARLVGVFLDTLHRNDLVYGDLSLKNMQYALDPVELLVMDMDGVHRISTPLVREKDTVWTPDWDDPHAPGQVPLGFDLDRYRYALLVYRLLAARNVSERLPSDADSLVVPAVAGLDEEHRAAVEQLLRRAAVSGVGSRPPVNEWVSALASA